MTSTTPYGPPPTVPRPRKRGGVVGPLILIFIGCVFLLQNTGYLPPNFWMNLWRLWPLILVLVGIELLLAHRIPWPALAGLAATILVVGAVATASSLTPDAGGPAVTQSVQTDLQGAKQAAITVRFGAGQLNVGAIEQPAASTLATMDYQGPTGMAPELRYKVVDSGVGQLEYQTSGRPGPGFIPFIGGRSDTAARVDLAVAPNVPITSLIVQTGATDARLDLLSLHVASIDMSIGAATTWVRFPETGATSAHISGGASTITLEIPQGVVAQIQHHGGLSTLKVDESRFPQVGDNVYRSTDYSATAANRVDITLETGVTTIQVN